MEKQTPIFSGFYDDYGSFFDFTQGDLEANRAGFVSHRQKQRQKRRLLIILILPIFLGSFILSLSCASIWLWIKEAMPFELAIMPFVALSIFGFAIFFLYRMPLTIYEEVSKGKLEKIVGSMRIEKRPSPGRLDSFYYVMVIDEEEFPLNGKPRIYFRKTTYIFYCLPKSRKIMSIEEAKLNSEKIDE